METINIVDIIDITKDGLVYKSCAGENKIIMFDECRKNWVNYVNEEGFVDWNGNIVKATFDESRYIGSYNKLNEVSYILLYGDVKIKIILLPNTKKSSYIQGNLPKLLYEIARVSIFSLS